MKIQLGRLWRTIYFEFRFVASVVAQPESTGDYEIVGESISYKKIAQIYTKVRGKPAKTRVLGTTD